MAEYIEREDAITTVRIMAQLTDNVEKALRFVGAADVKPVRHETWEWEREVLMDVYQGVDEYKCSFCGFTVRLEAGETFRYCPNCGAKMDGGGRRREGNK